MVVPRADSLPPTAGLSFSQGGAVGVKPCSSRGGRGSAGQNTGLVGPPGRGCSLCCVPRPGKPTELGPGLRCPARQGVPASLRVRSRGPWLWSWRSPWAALSDSQPQGWGPARGGGPCLEGRLQPAGGGDLGPWRVAEAEARRPVWGRASCFVSRLNFPFKTNNKRGSSGVLALGVRGHPRPRPGSPDSDAAPVCFLAPRWQAGRALAPGSTASAPTGSGSASRPARSSGAAWAGSRQASS